MSTEFIPCPLLRRLAAALYDTVLLLGVELLAFVPYTLLRRGSAGDGSFDPLALFWLLATAFLFFGWFWTHGGQTLGMRTWRIRVQTYDGRAIGWMQALLRFMTALVSWAALGLGFWWSLWDKDKMTWHDRWSESILVRTDARERNP
ncbi:RDD family protein [Sulfurivermis fontis]|uniref:RDD family protein n=1 Tax=Sulfurivermis fontis TaxID=1972068 RepID=UPI001E3C8CA3|nr:RDD family protein [Sulfurivermis fontis]